MGLTRIRAQQITDIDYKQAVRVVTSENVTLAGGAPNQVDGVNLSTGNRILVNGQDNKAQNGLYQVETVGAGSSGTWIRTNDGNNDGEIDPGMLVMVTEGTAYADTLWKLVTNGTIQIGVTELIFVLNTPFGFGNVYANGTGVVATVQNDVLTLTPGDNITIVGNAAAKSIEFSLAATITGNLIPSANVTYDLGSSTDRWKDIWLANSTIYLGDAILSAEGNQLLVDNQPVITSTTSDSLTLSGNIAGGNISGTNGEFINIFGNGAALTSITGANVTGTVANSTYAVSAGSADTATTAGTVATNAQPNITSVGTLSSLSVNGLSTHVGNIDVTGNINVTGNLNYDNVTDLVVGDPLIYIGANNNGNLFDLGIVVAWNDGTYQHGGWVRDASDGVWKLFGNVVEEPTTVVDFTNAVYQPMQAAAITATTGSFSGNITAGNVSATTGDFSTVTGNGRSLTSLNASNIDDGTLSSDRLTGSYSISVTTADTVTANAQPNITSVGTLSGLTVSGNIIGNNVLIQSVGEVRFFDSDNSNYVAFRSADAVTGNIVWTLPNADGTVGQVLSTDGAGNLLWTTGGSGGGGISWTTKADTPPVIALPGDFWYDSTTQIKYQYINDGTGNAWVDQSFPTVFETITTGSIVNSNANGVGNIGSSSNYFNTVFAKATSAQYADLAEVYESDVDYPPATVVVFGGSKEVTISTKVCDTRVAGVVSTDPAFTMNTGAEGVMVALTGRVPCRVQGPVAKGDVLITSDIPGTAQRIGQQWQPGCVIGKSLQDINDHTCQIIEVAVGRF